MHSKIASPVSPKPARRIRLAIAGDVMLGRLVDQVLPHPTQDEDECGHLGEHFRDNLFYEALPTETALLRRPWGDTLDLFRSADCSIINLETAITAHNLKWPNKMFNYRMSGKNIQCLKEANITYTSLANNHILDYGVRFLQLFGLHCSVTLDYFFRMCYFVGARHE